MEQQTAERSRGLAVFCVLLNRGKTPYLWSRARGTIAQGTARRSARAELIFPQPSPGPSAPILAHGWAPPEPQPAARSPAAHLAGTHPANPTLAPFAGLPCWAARPSGLVAAQLAAIFFKIHFLYFPIKKIKGKPLKWTAHLPLRCSESLRTANKLEPGHQQIL